MSVNYALIVLLAVLVAMGVYLILERTLTRSLMGFLLISNGIGVLYLVISGQPGEPPIYGSADPAAMTDPLPQAMLLTAIVITLGLTAFMLALAYRSWQLNGNDEVQDDVEDRRIVAMATRNELHSESAEESAMDPSVYYDNESDRLPSGADDEPPTAVDGDPTEGGGR